MDKRSKFEDIHVTAVVLRETLKDLNKAKMTTEEKESYKYAIYYAEDLINQLRSVEKSKRNLL
jgi:hypothetical protein